MWSQKLLAGTTATGIAICMFSFRSPDPGFEEGLGGGGGGVGSRWRTQRAPQAVPSPSQPLLWTPVGQFIAPSSRFLRVTGVGFGMSLLECPFVPLKDSSSVSPSASLPSPGNPSLTPASHTLREELGTFPLFSQTFLMEGAQCLPVPMPGTGALSQRALVPALCNSQSR